MVFKIHGALGVIGFIRSCISTQCLGLRSLRCKGLGVLLGL